MTKVSFTLKNISSSCVEMLLRICELNIFFKFENIANMRLNIFKKCNTFHFLNKIFKSKVSLLLFCLFTILSTDKIAYIILFQCYNVRDQAECILSHLRCVTSRVTLQLASTFTSTHLTICTARFIKDSHHFRKLDLANLCASAKTMFG